MIPEIKKILYCTNLGPEASYVFRYALSQAQHYSAVIHILHVVEPMDSFARGLVEQYISPEKIDSIHEQSRKHVIDRIKKRVATFCERETCTLNEGNNLIHDISVLEGQPFETTLKTGQELPADLIVMGSHRRKYLASPGILGSTARKVVNASTIPVLTVYTPKDQLVDLD
ncbi:MAG: universal stress protein [Desulfovermiculus sp.]|nr:universal stress protein [Desulfovermiculus sp.]